MCCRHDGRRFDESDECATEEIIESNASGGSTRPRMLCSCKRLGLVAVLRFQLMPSTNGLDALSGAGLPSYTLGHFLWALPVALLLLLFVTIAFALDRRALYTHTTHPAFPHWLKPRAFDLREEFLFNVRLRSSILRIFHVHAGHTPYTRVQLLHVLATSVALNAAFISLYAPAHQPTLISLATSTPSQHRSLPAPPKQSPITLRLTDNHL
jgi:hypothetical protein